MSRRWLAIGGVLALVLIVIAFFLWRSKERVRATGEWAARGRSPAFPTAVIVDSKGNLFVAAEKQNRILQISPARRVSIVAGNGSPGFGGDGGPAPQAILDGPVSIALDPAGNLFIADSNNNRIRRVDANTGIITTVAGDGSDFMHGGVGKAATATGVYEPVSVAIDRDENIYIGEGMPIGIRRVDSLTNVVGKVITGLPGDQSASLAAPGPVWVAVGEHGTLFYSEPSRHRVSQVNLPEGDVQYIAGSEVCQFGGDGGPASGAVLCYPEALSVSGDRGLYIADTGNNRIRRVDLSGGTITTVAGNGKGGYSGDGGPAVNASLRGPMGTTVDAKGNLYIADTGNNCIRKVDAGTGMISTWVTSRDLDSAGLDDR
jgi:sugar lactone lactonase YvrE